MRSNVDELIAALKRNGVQLTNPVSNNDGSDTYIITSGVIDRSILIKVMSETTWCRQDRHLFPASFDGNYYLEAPHVEMRKDGTAPWDSQAVYDPVAGTLVVFEEGNW